MTTNLVLKSSLLAFGCMFLFHRFESQRKKKLRVPKGKLTRLERSNCTQHVWVQGPKDGIPVVLVHGFGCCSLEFEKVAKLLVETGKYRVVLYDRVLYQRKRYRNPRTVDVLAAELHEILETLQMDKTPCIIAAHSYGGMVAQYFAAKYSKLVAGLLLIDPAHEDQFEPPAPRDFALSFKITPVALAVYRLLSPFGFARVMNRLSLMNFPPLFYFPMEERSVAEELYSKSIAWRIAADELKGYFDSDGLMRKHRELIPKVPVRVLVAGDRRNSPTFQPDNVTKAFMLLNQPYVEQENGSVLLVEDSEHWIHVERPDVVFESVEHIASVM